MSKENFLEEIIKYKHKEIEKRKSLLPLEKLAEEIEKLSSPRDFKSAISQAGRINLIAELKKASPSRGILREQFNPCEIAEIFELSGANALSV
ncbi:MAG: indole-3-glycerol-phosphate synthase TrpC, partial [Candidatus Omnitrophota bacterium]